VQVWNGVCFVYIGVFCVHRCVFSVYVGTDVRCQVEDFEKIGKAEKWWKRQS